jgi:tRNA uridine 5-carboxymethylaminomethyl modification enzyme
MFTSRAEYRLLLRHDNADRRLTPLGRRVGLVDSGRWSQLEQHERDIARATEFLTSRYHESKSLELCLRRPEMEFTDLIGLCPELASLDIPPRAAEQVQIESKYAGYIRRQTTTIQQHQRTEAWSIPESFDYRAVPQLRAEAREKLARIRPRNLGQAGRVSGITPADLAVLVLYLKERRSVAT